MKPWDSARAFQVCGEEPERLFCKNLNDLCVKVWLKTTLYILSNLCLLFKRSDLGIIHFL